MANYIEKLRDPRWQKRRLEIFERDQFTCQFCHSTEKTLNVHHKRYAGEPWESATDDLLTLCEDCHKHRSACEKALKLLVSLMGDDELDSVLGYAFSISIGWAEDCDLDRRVPRVMSTPGAIGGIASGMRINEIDVFSLFSPHNPPVRALVALRDEASRARIKNGKF